MTIPSIPNNGKGISNIRLNTLNVEQDIQVAAQENIQDFSSEQNMANAVVETSKSGTDEYSLDAFRRDYENLLYSKVLPEISKYEKERKIRLVGAICGCVVLVVIGVILFISINGRGAGDCLALCCTLAGLLWTFLKKSFEKKIKKKIMPTLMQAVPGFYWQEKPPVTKEDITAAMLFPYDKSCSKSFDDCFLGRYRGVEVLMSECTYQITRNKSTYNVFNGVVIRFEMNKKFEGLTVLRPKAVSVSDFKDLKKAKLEEVKLEDENFNKMFTIYSTDQIEARYLLTTSFMERLYNLTAAFVSTGTFCAFHDKYVYIAPYTSGDLFNLCSLVKPVTNTSQFETLFLEFTSILQFVDYFKLDKKLGL